MHSTWVYFGVYLALGFIVMNAAGGAWESIRFSAGGHGPGRLPGLRHGLSHPLLHHPISKTLEGWLLMLALTWLRFQRTYALPLSC